MNHKPQSRTTAPRLTPLAAMLAAASFTAMLGNPAHAQTADPAADAASAPAAAPEARNDGIALERVVVTATSMAKSKLKSSISVTTVDDDLVKALNPQTQSEVLRLIPGVIDNGGNGPGGNANISVRGLPVTTGGSPFVQLQEDGLPTVLFGDMNFGNNDYWVRFNRSNSVEAVRGGSASVLASGAPGAVINYVQDSGGSGGGMVGLEEGLNYSSHKGYFAVGGALGTGLRFHADGYLTEGAGLRDQGFNAQQGYQIKANLTKDLGGGLGWIRFNLKLLDDAEPLYTSYPALVNVNANGFSSLSPFPGFDARTGSTVGVYNQVISVLNSSTGQFEQKKSDGLHPVANAYGVQVHLTPGSDTTIDDKFRYTKMSGSFSTNFMGLSNVSSVIGSTVNGQTVASIQYANGPKKGTPFDGTYLNTGVQIYTHMGDMGSIANDLSLGKTFDLAGGKTHLAGGLFYMNQHIAQDWHPNQHYQTLDGVNPVALDLVSSSGQNLTINGVSGYNSAWGSGVDRVYDISAGNTAPYLNVNWEIGGLQLDLGVRHDNLRVTGWAESASSATNTTQTINGASVSTAVLDPATYEALHYGASYNSYSAGGLYALNNDTSAFLRLSRGGRFNVDRNILSGYTNADGSLTDSGKQKVVSQVQQQEIGLKNRGHLTDSVSYSANATLFHNTYSSSNFDLTVNNGTYYQSSYKSTGLEFEGSLRAGGFNMIGSLTWTDAKITANATGTDPQKLTSSGVGNQPAGTPSLMYMLAPSYSFGPVQGGLMFIGRGRTNVDNASEFWAPADLQVHLNLSWEFAQGATLGLNVHNLTNKLTAGGHLDGGFGGAGSINGLPIGGIGANNGRATVLSLNYEF